MKATEIKVYVGRWDLLPEDWEGINGLYEKTEDEIRAEISREVSEREGDHFIGVYTLEEFKDTFNQCLTEFISANVYWIF